MWAIFFMPYVEFSMQDIVCWNMPYRKMPRGTLIIRHKKLNRQIIKFSKRGVLD